MTDERRESTEEKVGEVTGGVGGAAAGAAIGSAVGPIGTIVGGIAGAVGGWWAGEKAGRAIDDWSDDDTRRYRTHYDRERTGDLTYDDAVVGYGVGRIAGRNPDYRGRSFDEVERDLRSGWRSDRYEYETMRPYVRHAFEQESTRDR